MNTCASCGQPSDALILQHYCSPACAAEDGWVLEDVLGWVRE